MLYGFSGVILQGAIVTLELALSSVVLAVLIGLVGAAAKLSQSRAMGLIFEGYTTLIRGVPDLVLMLLIFYGLQIALNTVTDAIGISGLSTVPILPKHSAVHLWLYQKAILKPRRRLALPAHKYFVALCSRR